jgi:hypothetical protein
VSSRPRLLDERHRRRSEVKSSALLRVDARRVYGRRLGNKVETILEAWRIRVGIEHEVDRAGASPQVPARPGGFVLA